MLSSERWVHEFGFDLDGEIEIMDFSWNHQHTGRVYEVFFPVQGHLLRDNITISESAADIALLKAESSALLYSNTRMQPPCFFLVLRTEMPWVLDAPSED